MSVSKFMAGQFARPTGWFGRLFMGPLLDRSNSAGGKLVFETLSAGHGERVLEVGFGGGELLLKIARQLGSGRIEGVELSEPMLHKVAQRARRAGLSNIGLHSGKVDSLPFPDATFNCACSVNTIYFWSHLEDGLRELARVILPGGRLVLGFGCDRHLREAGYEDRGFKLFAPGQVVEAFNANGFNATVLNKIDRKNSGPFYARKGIRAP